MTAALAVVGAAALALLGVISGHILTRVHRLEAAVEKAEHENRELWFYTRRLLSLYYLHRMPDAPDPPPLPGDSPN